MEINVVYDGLLAALDRTVPPKTSYQSAWGDAQTLVRALRRIEQAVMDASRLLDTFDDYMRLGADPESAVPSDEPR